MSDVPPEKVCVVCARPLYLGGADVRCRCDGVSLRAEIEQLRAKYEGPFPTEDEAEIGDTLGWFRIVKMKMEEAE